jgi:hypothetical protein
MGHLKCGLAFGIVLAALGCAVWIFIQVPILLAVLAFAGVVTWALITTINCLTSEGN